MTTWYVNIDDSYDTGTSPGGGGGTGTGAINNPFDWTQFFYAAQSGLLGWNFIALLEGHRTGVSGVLYIEGECRAKNKQNPWSIQYSGSFSINTGSNGYYSLCDGIISASNNNYILFSANTTNASINFFNVYVNSGNGSMNFTTGYINFSGCTLVNNGGVFDTINESGKTTIFNDCAIYAGGTPTFMDDWSTVSFNHCVGSFVFGSITGATVTTCQDNWTPVPIPVLPTISLVNTDYLEQTFAPDGNMDGHDITISSSGTFTGYTAGLFGGKARTVSHGIGAFYFGPEFVFISKPASVIPSSRKFIYQPVVTGGTPVSWTISGNPSGMTINASTGRVEWTPLSGASSPTVHVFTDSSEQIFTLNIDTAPRIISTSPDSATNGSLFNYQPVVVDAENNVSGSAYSLVNAPVGMTISATTGLVSWTPASTGTFHFTVKVVDANGLFDAQLVTLTVS